ncbi:MAG: hypothetical protein ACWGQW_00965 [bacterium]
MGLLDSLFGSSGGMQTAQVPRWNKQQQDLFQQLYGVTTPELGKGLTPTPEETQYGSFLRNYEPWYRSLTSEVTSPTGVEGVYAGLPDYIKQLYDPSKVNELYDPQGLKDYYQQSVIPEFEKTILPNIRGEFAGPGYWGSARANAVSDAYSNIGRQEAADLYGLETARRNSLLDLMGGERSALLSADLSKRADLLGLDTQGRTMLAGLAQSLPVAQQTLASWSRLFTPENSPYMNLALQLLQLQPFDTVAGMQQPTGGLLGGLLEGVGTGAGMVGGAELGKYLLK